MTAELYGTEKMGDQTSQPNQNQIALEAIRENIKVLKDRFGTKAQFIPSDNSELVVAFIQVGDKENLPKKVGTIALSYLLASSAKSSLAKKN
jgi:hypothetical protein